METILVTGAAGFIGSNLVKGLLEAGYSVIGLDDLSAGTRENIPMGTDFREVDITEPGLEKHFEGVSAIFHMAAKNCLSDCADNPVDTARINVMGTANVLKACVKMKVPHLIYSDSSAEYEGIDEFPSSIENINPLSVYACSKRGGALLCGAFSNLHDLKVTTVRYFNVYGPAQDWRRVVPPVMSAFTIRLLSGQRPIIYGDGSKSRDFIHVDDVNAFHIKIIQDPKVHGGTYNIGTGKDYSVLEIYKRIEAEINSGLEPIYKDELTEDADRTLADISETVATGWQPNVGLEEGIKHFIDYVRERLGKSIQPDKSNHLNTPL